jgi:carbonic anhydrase
MMLTHLRSSALGAIWIGMTFAILVGLILAGPAYATSPSQDTKLKPEEAIQRLKDGNERFTAGKSSHPNITVERREETSKSGQQPFATVVACSDSRLPVEILFDQGIGDLFVIRVAGNVCNVDEIGSAEYGTDHLATPALVVLGHTRCGAVTAVTQGAELHGNIRPLVQNIFTAVETAKKNHPCAKGVELLTAAIEANVRQSISDIIENSSIVRELVQENKLKIVGAVYDIEAGRVKWLEEKPDQEQSPEDAGNGPEHANRK